MVGLQQVARNLVDTVRQALTLSLSEVTCLRAVCLQLPLLPGSIVFTGQKSCHSCRDEPNRHQRAVPHTLPPAQLRRASDLAPGTHASSTCCIELFYYRRDGAARASIQARFHLTQLFSLARTGPGWTVICWPSWKSAERRCSVHLGLILEPNYPLLWLAHHSDYQFSWGMLHSTTVWGNLHASASVLPRLEASGHHCHQPESQAFAAGAFTLSVKMNAPRNTHTL